MPDVAVERRRVHVRGTVQGVGFRPQVYRVARELGLAGWVGNDAHGLVLEVEGPVPSNEGKLVAVVPLDQAESALAALRDHPLGAAAAAIGPDRLRAAADRPARDVVRWLPARRHAGARPAAAHLPTATQVGATVVLCKCHVPRPRSIMTSTALSTSTAPEASRTPEASTRGFFGEPRHRSAIALLAGALTMLLLIQRPAVRFYYTPLIVGLTYLAAAAVAGRKGALWAPGIITTFWGIAVLLGVHQVITVDGKLSYEIAAGLGVLLALALRHAIGLAAGAIGIVVSVGVIFLHNYAHPPSWVFHGTTFAVLLGVWGLWELRPAPRALKSSPTQSI